MCQDYLKKDKYKDLYKKYKEKRIRARETQGIYTTFGLYCSKPILLQPIKEIINEEIPKVNKLILDHGIDTTNLKSICFRFNIINSKLSNLSIVYDDNLFDEIRYGIEEILNNIEIPPIKCETSDTLILVFDFN